MKTKKLEGKLTLKKSTISNLNNAEKEAAKGGIIPLTSFLETCVKTYCGNSGYQCC
jgi:hypothetical protein